MLQCYSLVHPPMTTLDDVCFQLTADAQNAGTQLRTSAAASLCNAMPTQFDSVPICCKTVRMKNIQKCIMLNLYPDR